MTNISISTSDERVEQAKHFVKIGLFPDVSTAFNASFDKFNKLNNTKVIFDLIYMIGLPLMLFMVTIGLTLFTGSLFFYLFTALAGVYLIVFIYLFYDKYRGIKWQKQTVGQGREKDHIV